MSLLFRQPMRRAVIVSLTFGLALVALVLVTGLKPSTLAKPAGTTLTSTSLITQSYAIVATGPRIDPTPIAAYLTAYNNGGLQVLDGGIYVGDSASISHIFVNGAPPPPIDVVGGCPYCSYSGNAVANFNAPSLTIPALYDITDFEPGGVYAIEAGSNYHSFMSSQVFTGAMASGLYYINGNVTLQDITGTTTIVATGDIRLSGSLTLTTYDPRFPLLFTMSGNTSSGAIYSYYPVLDFTGDLYAPNGLIIFGSTGSLRGRVYARVVVFYIASNMTITYPIYDLSVLTVVHAGNGSGQVMLNPPGPNYAAGTVVTLTAVPSITSQFSGWSSVVITTANPITLAVNANQAITATFMLNAFVITPTASGHGSITPATTQTVNYGADITFTIAPDTRYHIVDVGVDGLSQAAITSYTFSHITANHTISAAFAVNASVITQTYVIAATGPSPNNISAHLSGPNGAGALLQIIGGGVYGGDGGYIQNVYVNGNPPPPVDFVGGCIGTCSISGNAVINFNAMPLPIPTLYNIADFQPGGVYAVAAGSHYHLYLGDQSFTGVMAPGLYFIDGNVTFQNVTGAVSIVTTGDISINGSLGTSTYDPRFPLLFTVSSNITNGAIGAHNPNLDLTGDLYAPNGGINIAGAMGMLRGRVYAKEIAWDASPATISCPVCDLSSLTLSLQKSVTPAVAVPYHGVVTYTNVLRNRDLVSDTYALFTDTLPAGVTFRQWIEQPISGVVQNGDNITWTGTISASTGITFTFTATHIGGYGDVITNTAYFSNATHTGSANAVFTVEPINYTLTVGYAGNGSGQVMLNPPGLSYATGTVVTLTAVPTITSHFSGWSGDVISTTNPMIVTMDSDKSITATFVTHRIYLPLIFK